MEFVKILIFCFEIETNYVLCKNIILWGQNYVIFARINIMDFIVHKNATYYRKTQDQCG